MDSCTSIVEITNTVVGLQSCWQRLLVMLFEKNGTFHVQEGLQNNFHDKTLQSLTDVHTAKCWVAF